MEYIVHDCRPDKQGTERFLLKNEDSNVSVSTKLSGDWYEFAKIGKKDAEREIVRLQNRANGMGEDDRTVWWFDVLGSSEYHFLMYKKEVDEMLEALREVVGSITEIKSSKSSEKVNKNWGWIDFSKIPIKKRT